MRNLICWLFGCKGYLQLFAKSGDENYSCFNRFVCFRCHKEHFYGIPRK